MRFRFGFSLVAAALALTVVGSPRAAQAVTGADLVVPQSTAERHGLTRAWFTQIPVGGRARIAYIVQDEGTLFVQTTDAMLYAIDAETGRMVWSQQVGSPGRPTMRPGANGRAAGDPSDAAIIDTLLNKTEQTDRAISARRDKVVAVANGTVLYLLNRADGSFYMDPKNNVQWKITLASAPEAGALVTEDTVFIPLVQGTIATYPITDTRGSPTNLPSTGHCVAPPVQVADRIAWATDKGVIHVTKPKVIELRHRIETTGPILARLTANPPRVFAGSIDGFLYCVNENAGDIAWKLTVGSAVRESPVVIRGAVLVASEDGGMFRASAADGHQDWFNPAARHFLAASPTKVYALDHYGHMLVINAKSGATIDTVAMPEDVLPVQNGLTDRVYLSSRAGLIQCLHEPGLTQPQNYAPPKPVEKPPEDTTQKAAAPK
ncbi:MAG TPA: PQQ-binding-like beta-propeller repeat protein, partial [Pirellulales bacterium]|nr:PQQ-binding-like beta-propeller repeat protein [Pirellulales bacterium]